MKLIIRFIFLLFPAIVSAQETENGLDPITVSANLTAQRSSITGRNIISIKGEAFQHLPVHSIDELLRYLPGLEVQARGARGAQSDIVIRGGTFQQVLVLLDGVRVNDPITGHFNSYIPIATSEIDRIEVLKGAASAIYGSEAVGGVIHIITKAYGRKNAGGEKRFEVSAVNTIGEYALYQTSLGAGLYREKTAIGLGMNLASSDGQQQRGTRGFFNNQTYSGSVNHRISPSLNVSLRSSYDKRDFSAQNFYTSFLSDTAKEEVTTFWNQGRIAWSNNQHGFSVDMGYKSTEDNFQFNPLSTPNNNRSKQFQSLLLYRNRVNPEFEFTTGFQYQNRSIRSNDRGDHSIKQAATFFVINKTFSNKFFLSPAVRVDLDERSGTEVVPQINLAYRSGSFQLRGSAGKTIRAADFTERFNNYKKVLVTGGNIGNPGLEAERSLSYEAGADYFLSKSSGKQFRISTGFFQRRHSNLIDWVVTPYNDMPRKQNLTPAGTYALAKNISRTTTTGVETDIQYSISLASAQTLSGSLGMVWLNSESTERSFYILSHANFLTNFNIQWMTPFGGLSVNGIYKDRQPQSASNINAHVAASYFLMNAKAEVFLLKKKAGIFIQVDNITGKTYQDLLGSQMPGRWIMGGFRISVI